jgi:hypothetical protein
MRVQVGSRASCKQAITAANLKTPAVDLLDLDQRYSITNVIQLYTGVTQQVRPQKHQCTRMSECVRRCAGHSLSRQSASNSSTLVPLSIANDNKVRASNSLAATRGGIYMEPATSGRGQQSATDPLTGPKRTSRWQTLNTRCEMHSQPP